MIEQPNSKVDWFFEKQTQWLEAMNELRRIALECGLKEELKWGVPCYTSDGKNIVLIHGFKEYCALLFVNGALLKDEKRILIQQTENVQSGRQVRFKDAVEIDALEPILKDYIHKAVAAEKAGLKVILKPTSEFTIPEELKAKLEAEPAFKSAFEGLTPGRQRAYILHFAAPKQAKTRADRIEKLMPHILAGKGLNDR